MFVFALALQVLCKGKFRALYKLLARLYINNLALTYSLLGSLGTSQSEARTSPV